ncbi:condensation domain-containing protein, partial [Chromobacterium amazonense]|uniref:condensation domain-containing protein n=1 Tax=Chromobacterium amazonense TaxID=1382803 RepID=UPI003F793DE1
MTSASCPKCIIKDDPAYGRLSPYGKLPLSSTQKVVWLDQIFHPDSSKYNVGFLISIEGQLDQALFARAFEAMVYRHDALRLKLISTDGIPLQELTNASLASLEIHDFSNHSDAEAKVEKRIQANFVHPFHLDGGLWRSELLRVSDSNWYWQCCCHHLIADGMCTKLLPEDLANLYSGLLRGEPTADMAPSYLDFIAEDRDYLNSQRYTKDLRFWRDRYVNPTPGLIPPSSSDKTVKHERVEPVLWQLDEILFNRIEDAVSVHGLSILHFMYAILACYFKRTTDADEIVIGIPVHNRRNAKQKRTVGMFVSVIPVGVTITPDDSFLDVMHKAAVELRRCYKHQRLPIAEINRQTQIQQKTGRAQLFDITLSLELSEIDACMQGPAIKYSKIHRETQNPLTIAVYQYTFSHNEYIKQPVTIELNFNANYLNHAEVMTLQSRLAVLIEAALTYPRAPVAS